MKHAPGLVAALIGTLLLPAGACSKKKPASKEEGASKHQAEPASEEPVVATQHQRWYRMEIVTEDEPIVFQLGVLLPLQESSEVVVANGEERLRWIMSCENDRECRVDMPLYAAALHLEFGSKRSISGVWSRDPLVDEEDSKMHGLKIPGPELEHRFVAGEPASVDLSGEWAIDFAKLGPARGHFVQDAEGLITGTLTPKGQGDARYLSGRVSGSSAQLSTFDGQRAYSVLLRASPDSKTLEGSWRYPGIFDEAFTGSRGEQPELLGELYVDGIRSKDRRISLPELDALKGKPVIVDLFGTWCPSCLDTVPTLKSLYAKHHEQGLEVLSIAFELTDDVELARERLKAFDEQFKPQWESILRPGADLGSLLPPEVEPAGFPITLFVNRDGTVHKMNTGFISPAAGEDHKTMVAAFETWADEIMQSSTPN